eukprot:scpid75149/ scgid26285/ Protein Wnt-5b
MRQQANRSSCREGGCVLTVTLPLLILASVCSRSAVASIFWKQIYEGSSQAWQNGRCDPELEVSQQSQHCILSHPLLKPVLRESLRIGIDLCKLRFRGKRFNCSINPNTPFLFGKGISKGSHRESAFIHALISASVTHGVARACSAGRLGRLCTCAVGGLSVSRDDPSGTQGRSSAAFDWAWSRCGDDTDYGVRIAKALASKPRESSSRRKRLHHHNYVAGYQVPVEMEQVICSCYGHSGSCTQKFCHVKQQRARTVSLRLMKQYSRATLVQVRRRSSGGWRLKEVDGGKPSKNSLVYSTPSPDYCQPDVALGYPGTKDRECTNDSSDDEESCSKLCCGRGFSARTYVKMVNCHCTRRRFPWPVRCQSCREEELRYFCK